MFEAIILGIIQGLSEFLPISSSGHLVLTQSVMKNFGEPNLFFDICLHAGTLIAVILYYWRDLFDLLSSSLNVQLKDSVFNPADARRMLLGIVVATIPAGLAGVLLNDKIESSFSSPNATSLCLVVTGLILFAGERFHLLYKRLSNPQDKSQIIRWILVGIAQAGALFPGISRSGSTISCGLALGWNRIDAARFSFLLMIPAVAGAVVLEVPKFLSSAGWENFNLLAVSAGTVTAGVTGYLAIKLFLGFIKRYRMYPFAIYCIFIGILSFVLNSF